MSGITGEGVGNGAVSGNGSSSEGNAVYLVHPVSLRAHRCRVDITRRGIIVRLVPDRDEDRSDLHGAPLRVPWWALCGFSADDAEVSPEGSLLQILDVVTDAGTLSLMAPAAVAGGLLSEVARHAARWNRARRPIPAAAARQMAVLTAGWHATLSPGVGPRAVARRGLEAVSWWRASAGRHAAAVGGRGLRSVIGASMAALLVGGALAAVAAGGVPAAARMPHGASAGLSPRSGDTSAAAITSRLRMAETIQRLPAKSIDLPPASAPPAPAPPSLADEPPLQPHEVLGFAPYWTLTQSSGFDLGGLSTIAYFGVGVNGNGTLDESGAGWNGYESQDLASLVTNAHASGVRVVLTIDCFGQSTLNALTSSPTAPTTLSAAVVQAIEAKNLDGLNIDFEGEGSADQAGLTALVTQLSAAVHAANPDYQVTMDTYASSAGDPGGFFDIPALAPAVDAFFVMAYQLNLAAGATPASPLTSGGFSELAAVEQYTSVVPAAKVIMGVPFYGLQWPTDNGTMAAQATGPATPVTYAEITSAGHPVYWDAVTDTAWTSFEVAGQWYEDYFEDPASMYMVAQLAQRFGLGGVGVWALGMDGNDPQLLAALGGLTPVEKTGAAGPTATSPSVTTHPVVVTPTTLPGGQPLTFAWLSTGAITTARAGTAPPSTTTPPSATPSSTTTTPSSTSTTPPSTTTESSTTPPSTTAPSGSGSPSGLRFSGIWQGQDVALTYEGASSSEPSASLVYVGQLTGFQTNDAALACLESADGLSVWTLTTSTSTSTSTSTGGNVDLVKATKPAECATAAFTFDVPSAPTQGTGTTAATSSRDPASTGS